MLRDALERGRNDALSRFGVKIAMMPPIAESPFAMPSLRGAMGAVGRGLSSIGRGVRRAAPLAALGALGATAYGLHKSNEEDRQKGSLVYAPMSGSFM